MALTPTVLIADDEPLFVSQLARQIRQSGLSFITETTTEKMFELARTRQPDLIILDIHQPMGRDLLSRLRDDSATRGIKVLVLTAYEDDEEDADLRAICMELGAHDFDLKPFDFTVVQKVVRLARGVIGEIELQERRAAS